MLAAARVSSYLREPLRGELAAAPRYALLSVPKEKERLVNSSFLPALLFKFFSSLQSCIRSNSSENESPGVLVSFQFPNQVKEPSCLLAEGWVWVPGRPGHGFSSGAVRRSKASCELFLGPKCSTLPCSFGTAEGGLGAHSPTLCSVSLFNLGVPRA